MAEYCEHDDDPNLCPPCRNKDVPLRERPKFTSASAGYGARTNARFKSQCPRCRCVIALNDWIVMTEDGWVCEDCAT